MSTLISVESSNWWVLTLSSVVPALFTSVRKSACCKPTTVIFIAPKIVI